MSIVKRKLTAHIEPPVPTREEIVEPRESTFTALVPEVRKETLLKYVDGKIWSVNYYSQILNKNDSPMPFDISAANVAQSYTELREVELKVSSALTYGYNEKTGISTLSGTAILPYKLRPNVGDLFIAKVDTGEDLVFNVTRASRKSHHKETLYEVDYSSLTYTNNDPVFVQALHDRIQDTYYYDNYIDSQNKFLLLNKIQKEAVDNLRYFLTDSTDYYFRTFNQSVSSSLLIPGFDNVAFDPVITNFIFNTTDASKYGMINSFNYSSYSLDYRRDNILTSLIKRRLPSFNRLEKKFGLIHREHFIRNARLGSFGFANVELMLHPLEAERDMLTKAFVINAESKFKDIPSDKNYFHDPDFIVMVMGKEGEIKKPILHELFIDDHYIVSPSFYEYWEDNTKFTDISFFEFLLYKFLKKQNIAVEDLYLLIEKYEDWSYLHQYYLLPVVWLIIKARLGVR